MRTTALASLALLLAGCVHTNQFRAARADQAAPDDPASAVADALGFRAWVRAGDWRGWPDDLEDQVTPVEVFLENQGADPLAIRPSLFTLLTPSGFRAPALEPDAVQRLVAATWPRGVPYVHAGYYGLYPWPGYPVRPHRAYPFAWWGPYPYYPPAVAVAPPPLPPAGPPGPPPVTPGTLERGGHVALLLIFPVPASQLPGFELTVELVTPAGESRGWLKVAMTRGP